MDYKLLLCVAFPMVGGLVIFRDGVKQNRLNTYLREHGVCTFATITNTSKRHLKDIVDFSVAYQDEQQFIYTAYFSDDDSNAKHSCVVGAKVSVYYDPLQPKRSALAEEVNSPWHPYGLMLFGAGLFTLSLYLLWVLWPQSH